MTSLETIAILRQAISWLYIRLIFCWSMYVVIFQCQHLAVYNLVVRSIRCKIRPRIYIFQYPSLQNQFTVFISEYFALTYLKPKNNFFNLVMKKESFTNFQQNISLFIRTLYNNKTMIMPYNLIFTNKSFLKSSFTVL